MTRKSHFLTNPYQTLCFTSEYDHDLSSRVIWLVSIDCLCPKIQIYRFYGFGNIWNRPCVVQVDLNDPGSRFRPNQLHKPWEYVPVSLTCRRFGVKRSENALTGPDTLGSPQKNTISPTQPHDSWKKKGKWCHDDSEALRWAIAVLRPVRESHVPILWVPPIVHALWRS